MFYAHTISPIAIAILTSFVMVIFIGAQYPAAGVIATIAMMGSFGPVVALSNLSNNLSQTLASGGEDGKRKSVVIQKFEILRNSKRNLLTNMLDVLQ